MLLRAGLLTLATVLLLCAQTGGIAVRSAPTDYATRNVQDGITVAASVVPADQVKKLFSKDLNHEGYVLVEVAVYPPSGGTVDISPDEFAFRVGSNPAILSSRTPAQIVAGNKQRTTSSGPPQLPGNVHVYETATIGVASGNPRMGQPGGVYTGTGTTVAVGGPQADPRNYPGGNYPGGNYPPGNYPPGGNYPPQTAPAPRGAQADWTGMKRELEERELPSGRFTQPVAGYLYFLKPATKDKRPDYELDWYRTAGQIRLSIPAPK